MKDWNHGIHDVGIPLTLTQKRTAYFCRHHRRMILSYQISQHPIPFPKLRFAKP